jgi:DNA-binding transcriptional regulator GbsR (MarR family)
VPAAASTSPTAPAQAGRVAAAAGSDAPPAGAGQGSAAHLIRTGGRDPELVVFETAVVSFFFDAADLLGVPKSVAAIYGICFASAEPLSLSDIDARLDISIGSISQGLRVLREVGALKVVASPASHPTPEVHHARGPRVREYYAPDLELRKLAARFIEQRLERQLKAGRSRLESMKASIPAGPGDSAKELKARLRYLESWHDKGKALVPLVKTFLKLG